MTLGSGSGELISAAEVVLIGMGLFGVVMAGEPYLCGGVRRHAVGNHIARLAMSLAGIIALGLALDEVALRML